MPNQERFEFDARQLSRNDDDLLAEDRLHFLALSRFRGIGFASMRLLYDRFPRLADVWPAPPETLVGVLKGGGALSKAGIFDLLASRSQLLKDAQLELDRMRRRGIELVTDRDPRYPASLRDLSERPRWLFVQGDVGLLQANSVAVVGPREPTEEGLQAARTVATILIELGIPVVSGLAEGVDAAVHQAVIDLGGRGIAVLGHGINVIFPAATAGIREGIVKGGGLLVSEYLPYEQYSRQRFIHRNRIQAALARLVVPIQGAWKSGTAHTVSFAEQLGREVIGVQCGVLDSVPQNEIVGALRAQGHRVYDLREEQEALRQFFSRYENAPVRRLAGGKLQALTREFQRLLAQYEVSESDLEDLFTALREIWRGSRGPRAS